MTLSNIEQEFNEINDRSGWDALFKEIREKCDKEAKEKLFAIEASSKSVNRTLNRYRDVNPYDHSRIIIHRGKIDYINANLVKMERAERSYILTQGPLKETVGHFWLMIWEQNTKAIVMLNKLIEKKQIKCYMYWPARFGSEHALHMEDVGLNVEYLSCEENTNYSMRTFRLTDFESNNSREVIQFHYTTWPDFSIPSSPVAFLLFLKQVRDSGALDTDVGPAVIHCSAGIGRSGTFCLVDCCLVVIEKEGEHSMSVQSVLYELRKYRMGLIQTSDQLYFSYQAIIQGIKLLKDPNFNDYENVPLISHEDILDESPPPLPPRSHSLHSTSTLSTINKPLPIIPNSESVNEDLITNAINTNSSDYANNETNIDYENNRIDRPLPPLPEIDSLGKVAESESEDEANSDEISEGLYENKNFKAKQSRKSEEIGIIGIATGENEDGISFKNVQNGVENTTNQGSDSTELRRRKRVERQALIEKKVHDIKRKQREVEDDLKTTKKRRSLIKYIIAGVFVGTICVYAYSKFG